MAAIRLQNQGDCYTIDSEFWVDLLDWAQDNGWSPSHPRELYDDSWHRLSVSAEDSANLADALEFIAGDLVLHELSQVPDRFLRDLVDSLARLAEFFHRGAFTIESTPGQNESYRRAV